MGYDIRTLKLGAPAPLLSPKFTFYTARLRGYSTVRKTRQVVVGFPRPISLDVVEPLDRWSPAEPSGYCITPAQRSRHECSAPSSRIVDDSLIARSSDQPSKPIYRSRALGAKTAQFLSFVVLKRLEKNSAQLCVCGK